MKKKTYSMIRSLHNLYVSITVFLLAIIIIFSLYCLNTVQKQFNDAQQQTLNLYMNEIDNALAKTTSSLLLYQLQGTFPLMRSPDSQELYRSKKSVTDSLTSTMLFLDYCDGLFLYDYESDEFAYAFNVPQNSNEDYNARQSIPDIAYQVINESKLLIGSGWYLRECNNDLYLFYLQWADGVCCGSWLNTQCMLPNASVIATHPSTELVLTDDQNQIIAVNNSNFKPNPKNYTILSCASNIAPICLNTYTPNNSYLDSMSLGLQMLLFFSVIAILTIPITHNIINRIVKKPLNHVLYSISQYEEGNTNYRPDNKDMPKEIILVNDALVSMYHEIQDLKIDIYEKQLNLKDIHLQYLQHQIKPHFVINILNAVSLMAQMKENNHIIDVINYLSQYLRNMINTSIRTVTVSEEIQQLNNYIQLQKIRYPNQVKIIYDIESKLNNFPIPILTFQTLVENIFKHALEAYEEMVIEISGNITDDNVHFIIRDNGPGFDIALINDFNQNLDTSDQGKHIGLTNIRQRLELEYPGKASLKLSNNHGAVVIITLPYKKDDVS